MCSSDLYQRVAGVELSILQKNRSRTGQVVVELTSVETWKSSVTLKNGKCGVMSRQTLSAEKLQQTLVSSRDCHCDHSLSYWSVLPFSLCERSSSENRTHSAGVISIN